MWRPSGPQWAVIWVGFAMTLWFFYSESQRTLPFSRAEHIILGIFVVAGTALLALLLYWLERKREGDG